MNEKLEKRQGNISDTSQLLSHFTDETSLRKRISKSKYQFQLNRSKALNSFLFIIVITMIIVCHLLVNNNNNKTKQASSSTSHLPWYELQRAEEMSSAFFPEIYTNRGVPVIPVNGNISCYKLFNADEKEMGRARLYHLKNHKVPISTNAYLKLLENCKTFKEKRGYIFTHRKRFNIDYPLAFSILMSMNTAIEQTERLLRAIYRPQNFYCFHVDAKAKSDVKKAMKHLANCFPNVYLKSEISTTLTGNMSKVSAHLLCMKDLLKDHKWNYFITLSGEDFPLGTNAELVKVFKSFLGTNDMERRRMKQNILNYISLNEGPRSKNISTSKGNIKLYQGDLSMALNKKFVDYVVKDNVSKDFLEWCQQTNAKDNVYFPSLNFNKHLAIPGGFYGNPALPSLTIFRISKAGNVHCNGKFVEDTCIFSVRDLPLISKQPQMFLSRFELTYQPLVLDCLEKKHFDKLIRERSKIPKKLLATSGE